MPGDAAVAPAPVLLAVDRLAVRYPAGDGEVTVVDDLSLRVERGATLGIVGESGAGKSQAMLAVAGLCPEGARVTGSVRFEGRELVAHPERAAAVRGRGIAYVFQDPGSALNPYLTIGAQMREVLAVHENLRGAAARARALDALAAVRIADAASRLSQYPHELSGGMRQRALIALALLCGPRLLIADEPTTALDVTVQADLLALLESLRRTLGLALVVVSHDLGVVARICDRVVVMYGGRPVEEGSADDVFHRPAHPYTRALLRAVPRIDVAPAGPRVALPGQPVTPDALPPGCAFHPRCAERLARCARERPALVTDAGGRRAACHLLART
jgi:oligopeptide/dipeptide ABC transporter ATP-binding protein